MEKEWISEVEGKNKKFRRETLLNYGVNRWGLNKAKNIGATSELIRICAPKEYDEWKNFYFENAFQKKKNGIKITPDFILQLGQQLYIKLSEVVHKELSTITEQECIDYAYNLVLNRTFEGYKTEIETIYGQLEELLNHKIEPAPDNWDRSYNVDFYIKINSYFIGIQIKPISSGLALNQYQWTEMHKLSHEKFEKNYSGKVFFVYSTKNEKNKKSIYNIEVIDEIKNEIVRLSNLK